VLTAVTPSVPRNLSQNTNLRYRDALIYRWNAPLKNGSSKLEVYTLEITDLSTDAIVEHIISIQASTFKFSALTPATEYAVRIKVNNLVGESDWSDSVLTTTGIEPSRPGLLSFDASTRSTLQLSWQQLEGADTGGSDSNPLVIDYYQLYINAGEGYYLHTSIAGSESSLLLINLKAGINYKFKVQTENNLELLSSFSPEQYMVSGQLPTAPGQPMLMEQSSTKITFSWKAPFDNGGTSIAEYELLITDSNSAEVSKMITSSLQYEFTVEEGLVAGKEYKFKLRARNYFTYYYN
jgi:hypothetical protein